MRCPHIERGEGGFPLSSPPPQGRTGAAEGREPSFFKDAEGIRLVQPDNMEIG